MLSGPPRRRRPRPVPDAPLDELLARAEDLAKGWLLALLEQAPLAEAPRVAAGELSRDGPRMCEAVVRALGEETDLRRLQAGGALRLLTERIAELTGAAGAEELSRGVEALRAVVWSALMQELRDPEPELVAALAERLALVCELVREAGLEGIEAASGRRSAPGGASAADPASALSGSSAPASHAPLRLAPREDAEPREAGAPRPAAMGMGEPAPPALRERESRPLWVGALEEEIEQLRERGSPLALLLVELEDSERLVAAESPQRLEATFGEFARAVRSVARRQDILVSESDSRAWIIARDTGRAGARSLAARLTEEVAGGSPLHGAAPAASVGLAVLGEDGRTPDELIEAAEEARFAASAAGVDVAEHELCGEEGPGSGEEGR